MTTATFGEIAAVDQSPQEPSSSAAPQDAQLVDPNDPRLTSETITDNPDADAYATPPPAPDGKWRAKAKQVDIKDPKGQLQRYAAFNYLSDGKPFFATNVEFGLIDLSGKFDGTQITTYHVRTNVDAKKGTSQSDTLVRKLGGKTLPSSTDKSRIDLLLATLASEPELIVETAWEASCMACAEVAEKKGERKPKAFLRGMHRFPATRTPGVHDPNVTCPVCKASVRAQVRVVQFFGLKETAATQGTGK